MANNYSFKWNNFRTNLSNGIQQLRNDNEFLDITLCSDNGEESIQAHQIILAACSPLFRQILKAQNNNKSNSCPILYLKGVYQDDLFALLDYMYQGETSVAVDSVNSFLALAEDLEVKGLCSDNKPNANNPVFPVSLPLYNQWTQRNFCCIENTITDTKINQIPNNANNFSVTRPSKNHRTIIGHWSIFFSN